MPRGGRRPGAGAPRGNLNALRSGRYSSRYRTLIDAISSIPEIRDMLLAHHRLQKRKQRQAIKLLRLSLINTLLQDPAKFNQIIKLLNPPQNPSSHLEKTAKKTQNNQSVKDNQNPCFGKCERGTLPLLGGMGARPP